jgi:GNAT superfamily N-acetyltransferase
MLLSEAAMEWRVERLTAKSVPDFYRLHSERCDAGWCRCVAWWVPSWEGWGERTAEENLRLRQELFARGEHDGYLLYEGEEPIAWCQVGPRDRLEKLRAQFDLEPDARAWAISCILVAPKHRRSGVSRRLLHAVLADLRTSGVTCVEAFPRRGELDDELELWNGPAAIFREAGFEVVKEDEKRLVMRLPLAGA